MKDHPKENPPISRNRSTPRVTVLLSGGIDSSACLAFYLNQGLEVDSLFIDYGHPAAKEELLAAKRISTHFGTKLDALIVSGGKKIEIGFLTGRNALLLNMALTQIELPQGILGIGVHAGTGYKDCSRHFIDTMQLLIDVYEEGRVKIGAPFLEWKKSQIIDYGKSIQLPFKLTYSCETGAKVPCGRCSTCKDLISLRVMNVPH